MLMELVYRLAVESSPLVLGGRVFVGSGDGFLYALNTNGSLRWKLHTGGITESSPVIGPDGTIYLGVNQQRLWATLEKLSEFGRPPSASSGQSFADAARAAAINTRDEINEAR